MRQQCHANGLGTSTKKQLVCTYNSKGLDALEVLQTSTRMINFGLKI